MALPDYTYELETYSDMNYYDLQFEWNEANLLNKKAIEEPQTYEVQRVKIQFNEEPSCLMIIKNINSIIKYQ